MIAASLFASFLLGIFFLLWKYSDRAIGTAYRPDLKRTSEKGYPLIGNLIAAITTGHFELEYWTRVRKEFGHVGTTETLPMIRMIDVSSPDQIEYIQRGNFSNYAKGPLFEGVFQGLLGDGIFNSSGHAWIGSRKTLSKVFTNNQFNGVISEVIEEDLAVMDEILSKHASNGTEIDLQGLFFNFTLSSFTKIAFGQDIEVLTTKNSAPHPFAVAFDIAQSIIPNRFANPLWGITEYFSKDGQRLSAALKVIDKFAYTVIDEKLETLRLAGPEEEKQNRDILSLFSTVKDDNGLPLSRKVLRDHVINVIIAGRDTTAQGLSWTFFNIVQAIDPKLLSVLRTEIDSLGEVTYANHKQFVNVHAVFNEGLRLHPPVARNAWQAIEDDQIPNGPMIKAGDRVRWSDWQMARDPAIWGEDCELFKPLERWLQTDSNGVVSMKQLSNYQFHVFNAGPRLCLGMGLANFEAISVLVTILRRYDLSFAKDYMSTVELQSVYIPPHPTPVYGPSVTHPMKEPLRMIVKRRAAQ